MLEEYGGSGRWPVPREITPAELDLAVAGFVDAATRARAAGFDGVEIHAANGYLLDQFLTGYTNSRTDEYGGTVRNRIRLTARIVDEIRNRVGGDFVVGVRLSQTKVNDLKYRWPGGAPDAEAIFAAVADAGADYLHIASEGRNFIDTARFADGRTITAVAERSPVFPSSPTAGCTTCGKPPMSSTTATPTCCRSAVARWPTRTCPNAWATVPTWTPFDHAMLSPMATISNTRSWWAAKDAD